MPYGQRVPVVRARCLLRFALVVLSLTLTLRLGAAAPALHSSAPTPPAPLDDKPLVALVEHFLSGGQQRQAERMLTKAVAQNPQSLRLLFWRAVCTCSRLNAVEASGDFSRVIKLAPTSPEALASGCILGIDLAPDWSTRLEFYQKLNALSALHPDDNAILWLAAMASRLMLLDQNLVKNLPLYLHQPILNQGIAHYQTLLAHWSPGMGPFFVQQTLSNLLGQRFDTQLALPHCKLAVSMEPTLWPLESYARTLNILGRYQEAIAPAFRAVALSPWQDALQTLGDALWGVGRRDEALTIWNKEAPHDSIDALINHGRRALNDGHYDQAWQYFLIASAIGYPPSPYATIYLARTAVHLHQPGANEAILTTDTLDHLGCPTTHNAPPSDPWWRAVESSDLASLTQLVKTNAIDRRSSGDANITALMLACPYGWSDLIQFLVAHHAQLDLQDDNGNTALHYGTYFKQPDSVRRLLAAGANPNIQNRWSQTPLIEAVGSYSFDAVSALVAHGADLTLSTPNLGTALDRAVVLHDRDSLLLLLAHGANPNATIPDTGETPLMMIDADHQNFSFLQPLLASGADIHLRDRFDLTALHRAIIPDLNRDFVTALLDAGADPHATSTAGLTPITLARALGYEELATAMETRSGHTELFHLPAMPPLIPDETPLCAAYILPVRLAYGQPCNLLDFAEKPDRAFARAELKNAFGLENHDTLKTAIDQLNRNTRADTPARPDNWDLPAFEGKLVNYTETVFIASDKWTAPGCSAWAQSHRIYLAELGRLADYLSPAESDAIIADASSQISQHSHNWDQFTKSFLAGAERFENWNLTRYQHICGRLMSGPWTTLLWPKVDAPGTDPAPGNLGSDYSAPVATLTPAPTLSTAL